MGRPEDKVAFITGWTRHGALVEAIGGRIVTAVADVRDRAAVQTV
jgi:hypothetical protein